MILYLFACFFHILSIITNLLYFQISDIVAGQEPHVSAKEILLRWAKRTTHKYPGVRVVDFTNSWRDGLAFSAIIHRNRPDLLDWRQARTQHARERMETAFHIAEREYGVTRLLDPEGNRNGMIILVIQNIQVTYGHYQCTYRTHGHEQNDITNSY